MLYLTYNNSSFTDGAGAQLQRILGIYALCKLLGCRYVHSPLSEIGYQGLSVLESGEEISNLCYLYNSFYKFPDYALNVDHFDGLVIDNTEPDLTDIALLQEQSILSDRDILLRITLPYKIIDQYPGAYKTVHGLISDNSLNTISGLNELHFFGEFNSVNSSIVTIAVHVRRGELFAVDSHRMLSNQYYIAVCKAIARILDLLGKQYRFHLYTEIPTSLFIVSGKSHGILNRINKDVAVTPEQLFISEFDVIPNLTLRVNEHQVSTLFNLSTADILVGSRSSFSYVAAVAGTVKATFLPQFWHSLLPGWIETDPKSGAFDMDSGFEILKDIESF